MTPAEQAALRRQMEIRQQNGLFPALRYQWFGKEPGTPIRPFSSQTPEEREQARAARDTSRFFEDTTPTPRSMPADYFYGPAMWASEEAARLARLGAPVPTRGIASGNVRYSPRDRDRAAELSGVSGATTSRVADNAAARAADAARLQGQANRFAAGPAAEEPDWASILSAMGGTGGGGGGVPSGMFRLYETPEEQQMLARELAEIERRQAAGEVALRQGWGEVQSANAAAAEKARAMVSERGETAAGYWTQAAQQARDLAAQRAAAAGDFAGRAAIDVSPDAGSADWVGFMESQAPSERRFAERQQEILGEDLDWMAGMAAAQGQAYAGDLRRQADVMSFERAREHNLRVQDRINQERMALANMQFTAGQSAQAQQSPLEKAAALIPQLYQYGESAPFVLANLTGLPKGAAQWLIDSYGQGVGGQALQAELIARMGRAPTATTQTVAP